MSDLGAYEGESAEIRALIEDISAIRELEQQPGWPVLIRYVNQWLEANENRLRSGNIDDLQEYKLVAGRVDGIRQILHLPEQLDRMLDTARDNASNPARWQDEFTDSFALLPEDRPPEAVQAPSGSFTVEA